MAASYKRAASRRSTGPDTAAAPRPHPPHAHARRRAAPPRLCPSLSPSAALGRWSQFVWRRLVGPGSPLTPLWAWYAPLPLHPRPRPAWSSFPAAFWPVLAVGRSWEQASLTRSLCQPFVRRPRGSALRASLWRDALRPDTLCTARRVAEGKGGAAWRRDRTRAQPRAAAPWRRAWRARGGPTPCPQRAPWHPCQQGRRELSTAEKFKFFLSSDSGCRNHLILFTKIGVDQRKRAGRSEETGGWSCSWARV